MWRRIKKVFKYILYGGEGFIYTQSKTNKPLTPEQQKKFDAVFKSMDEFFKEF